MNKPRIAPPPSPWGLWSLRPPWSPCRPWRLWRLWSPWSLSLDHRKAIWLTPADRVGVRAWEAAQKELLKQGGGRRAHLGMSASAWWGGSPTCRLRPSPKASKGGGAEEAGFRGAGGPWNRQTGGLPHGCCKPLFADAPEAAPGKRLPAGNGSGVGTGGSVIATNMLYIVRSMRSINI